MSRLSLMLVAAEGVGGGVDLTSISQFGAIGAIAILGIVFARTAYKRETDRSDHLQAENARLNGALQTEKDRLNLWIQEKVLPVLLASARANEDSQDLLREMYAALKDLYGPAAPTRRPRRANPPDEEHIP